MVVMEDVNSWVLSQLAPKQEEWNLQAPTNGETFIYLIYVLPITSKGYFHHQPKGNSKNLGKNPAM